MALRTEYEFVLPKGYLDDSGVLHKRGVMRLATARDELDPLRDPFVTGPDDPRLTILVLARAVTKLGSVSLVTTHEIENLFAADLAYLQDFYGVINFGTPQEIDALLEAQAEVVADEARAVAPAPPAPAAERPAAPSPRPDTGPVESSVERPLSRRSAIEEVPSGGA